MSSTKNKEGDCVMHINYVLKFVIYTYIIIFWLEGSQMILRRLNIVDILQMKAC